MAYVQRQSQAGFTLIEIMIALAIVVLIGGIGGGYAYSAYKQAKLKATKQQLKVVGHGIEQFREDMNQYPDGLEDLINKPSNEELAKEWVAPYVSKKVGDVKAIQDAWGNKFVYEKTPDAENPFELFSYGQNGKKAPRSEWLSYWKQ